MLADESAPPESAATAPAADAASTLAAAKEEIAALKKENEALRTELAELKANGLSSGTGAQLVPPPVLWPPAAGPPAYSPYGAPPYGAPPAYGAPPPYGAPPAYSPYVAPPAYASSSYGASAGPPATLPLNYKNERGPKGANLAIFCIPNSYYDQQVYDLASPYGELAFCQVATHRDTGLSRGYAFVSYRQAEDAQKAISSLHNLSIEGRALRVEMSKSDGAKPY